jgi:iron transport multicopper oxidase
MFFSNFYHSHAEEPGSCKRDAATTASFSVSQILLASALTLSYFSGVSAAVVTYNWTIGYVNNVNADGLYERTVIGVNGKWPVEKMEAFIGDTLVINVKNTLDVPTAIHSHGLFQNGTVFYDGASMMTQCPIPPGGSLSYRMNLIQHGTYWVHGHLDGQYVDGLRAPLIIHAKKEVAKYDEEIVMTLADWYYLDHTRTMVTFMSPLNPGGFEPLPNNALINEAAPKPLNLSPGKTYRLRLICMSAFISFNFYIDGHNLTVIEMDGIDTQPYTTSSIMISAAQRYSVLIKAPEANPTVKYTVHADMDVNMFDIPPTVTATSTEIIYTGVSSTADVFQPEVGPESLDMLDDALLVPVEVIPAFENVNNQVTLVADFKVYTDAINHGAFNDTPFVMPKTPLLFTAMGAPSEELAMNPAYYGPNSVTAVMRHFDVVELVIINLDAGTHPFHLHGHVFQTVALSNDSTLFDPTNTTAGTTIDLSNPPRRDTIRVPGGGYAVLRFVADNPGAWFMHCHIEWHFQQGLAASFIEAPEVLRSQSLKSVPSVMAEHCSALGINMNANGAGNQGLDFTGYAYGPAPLPGTMTTSGWIWLTACAASALVGVITVVWYAAPDKK